MQAHPSFRALIPFLLEQFIQLVCSVALLAWQLGILSEQFISPLTIRSPHWRWLGFAQSVGLGWPIENSLINGFPGMPLFAGNLPLTFPFQIVSSANGFVFFHRNHLQFS